MPGYLYCSQLFQKSQGRSGHACQAKATQTPPETPGEPQHEGWAWGLPLICVFWPAAVNAPAANRDPGDTPGIPVQVSARGTHLEPLHPLPTVGWMYKSIYALGAEVWALRDSDTRLMEGRGGPMRCPQGHYFCTPDPLQPSTRRIITTHQGAECPPYCRHSHDLAEREEEEVGGIVGGAGPA